MVIRPAIGHKTYDDTSMYIRSPQMDLRRQMVRNFTHARCARLDMSQFNQLYFSLQQVEAPIQRSMKEMYRKRWCQ
jgi:hypothetical protein